MKALVLVGGFGTRLRPITYEIPKQLIPIAGKPMLYHVLDLLPPEVDEVVLASGYKADVLQRFLAEHPPKVPVQCIPEAEPLGTGGGMRNAGDGMSDPFLLLNSDVIAEIDVPSLIAFHHQKGGVGAMTLSEVEDPEPYGVAALDASDRIERFVEKPKRAEAPSHWINAGLQIWRREVLDLIPKGRPVSFETEIVPPLLPRGIFGFRSRGFWEDAGTPPRLLRAQRLLFDAGRGGRGVLPKGGLGRGPVAVGASVEARGASFGPYVTLGDHVHVGAGAHVEDCVLMDHVQIGEGASVRRSIVGPGIRVGAGQTIEGVVLGARASV
ncbi:MAG: NDP-sugar synthase [Thermoplasmata archaeon]|nr:NDP-sugar synthase [Thermoplasmata archaeon]